jgi:nucleotide-binding universal stress UspA family protein
MRSIDDITMNKNTIIWALDPAQNPEGAINLVKELKTWSKSLGCKVQPVSIFTKPILSFPVDTGFISTSTFQRAANNSVNQYIKSCHASGFLPPEIIYTSFGSTRRMAAELIKYAKKNSALLIFANTRAKKNLNPFRIGGFAETLAATSRIPVMLFNSSAKPFKRGSAVLFPTDFGHDSKRALVGFEPLAKAMNAPIILYNQVESSTIYPLEFNGSMQARALNFEKIIKKIEDKRTTSGEKWVEMLNNERIKNSVIIRRQKKYLGSEIVDIAKKNDVGFIAMSKMSGPVAQMIMGSISRDVLLTAKCPVLIFYRPKVNRKKKSILPESVSQKGVSGGIEQTQPRIEHHA